MYFYPGFDFVNTLKKPVFNSKTCEEVWCRSFCHSSLESLGLNILNPLDPFSQVASSLVSLAFLYPLYVCMYVYIYRYIFIYLYDISQFGIIWTIFFFLPVVPQRF